MEKQCQCATASASKKESKKKIHGKQDEAAERREHDKKGDVSGYAKGEVPLLYPHGSIEGCAVSQTSIEEASL